jgi:hypothetical protein
MEGARRSSYQRGESAEDTVKNNQGSDEVIEVTYDREARERSDGMGMVDFADEMGMDPFSVWYGSIRTII